MKEVHIGGQAVLEGIMMKGPESYALSVRKPDHEIEVTVTKYKSFGSKSPLLRIPIIRGVVNFIESLYIGVGTLMKSAEYDDSDEKYEQEWLDDKQKKIDSFRASGNEDKAVKLEKKVEKHKESVEKAKARDKEKEGSGGYLVLTLIISLAFAIAVFMLLPTFVAGLLYKVTDSSLLVNLAEGILRMMIFIGYVWLISMMEEIHRTFMYHGAEHKTINCMEAGVELTPENVMKHTRFHRRCGTSFLFIVMFISIIVSLMRMSPLTARSRTKPNKERGWASWRSCLRPSPKSRSQRRGRLRGKVILPFRQRKGSPKSTRALCVRPYTKAQSGMLRRIWTT